MGSRSGLTPDMSFLSGVPRRVRLLVYALAVNNLSVGYFQVYLTGYLPQVNVGAATVGLLIAVEGAVVILVGVPLGLLSDRKGRKWILILGSAGVAPAIFIFVFTRSLVPLLLSAVLFGLAESATLASWNAILADQTDVESRTSAFSLSFVVSNVLTAVGFAMPLAFPAINSLTGASIDSLHIWTLGVLAAANLSTPLFLWVLLRGYREVIRQREAGSRNWGIIAKFTTINGLIGFGAGLIIPLIPTWMLYKFRVSDSVSGPLLALSNVTIGFGSIASPALSKRLGVVGAIVTTTGISTLFMFSLAVVPNVVLAGSVYVVRSMLMNMSSPLLDSFIMSQVRPEERGFTSAVNSVIWRLPNSVSTYVGGVLLQSGYFDLPFYLAGVFYVAGITSFYAVFRRAKPVG
jgi:MFS family permease